MKDVSDILDNFRDQAWNAQMTALDSPKGLSEYLKAKDIAKAELKALMESVIGEESDYPVNTPDKNLNMANANKILVLRDVKTNIRKAFDD